MFGELLSFAGSRLDARDSRKAQKRSEAIQLLEREKDRDLQKEFAQRSVRWRVDDAKAAGLHPLFALGAAGSSYTPTAFIPGQAPSGSHHQEALGAIGRGVDAFVRRPNAYERQQSRYERRLQQMRIESEIEANKALTAQRVADVSRRQVAPGTPTTVVDSPFGPAVRVNPVRPENVTVVPPRVQRPLPPNVISNFMGLGDLTLGPGASGGDVEERGGEFMGLLHSIGQTVKALGADALDELKYIFTLGKKGSPPWKWR